MSIEGKIYEFDADEMVKEMQFVMRKGLSNIFKEFIDRHELLEKTHKQIMQLPSVLNELNKIEPSVTTHSAEDKITEPYRNVTKDIDELHDKIERMEQKFGNSINQILELFKELTIEFATFKNDLSKTTICVKPQIKSSIVAACENENIKVEVEEEEEEEEEVEEEEEEVEEEEEEEEVEEEVEEVEEEVEEVEEEVETEASSDEDEEDEIHVKTLALSSEEPLLKEEEELSIITIDDVDYCTNDEENGFIWGVNDEGEQGDKVGYLKDGEPFFYADEK